jgi:hypothetical protein
MWLIIEYLAKKFLSAFGPELLQFFKDRLHAVIDELINNKKQKLIEKATEKVISNKIINNKVDVKSNKTNKGNTIMQFLDKLEGLLPKEDIQKAKDALGTTVEGLMGSVKAAITAELESVVAAEKAKLQEDLAAKVTSLLNK